MRKVWVKPSLESLSVRDTMDASTNWIDLCKLFPKWCYPGNPGDDS